MNKEKPSPGKLEESYELSITDSLAKRTLQENLNQERETINPDLPNGNYI